MEAPLNDTVAFVASIAAVSTAFAAWWATYAQNKRARLTISVNLTQQFSLYAVKKTRAWGKFSIFC
jgi:hypothetical protein